MQHWDKFEINAGWLAELVISGGRVAYRPDETDVDTLCYSKGILIICAQKKPETFDMYDVTVYNKERMITTRF